MNRPSSQLSRRNFLKSMLGAVAAVAVAPFAGIQKVWAAKITDQHPMYKPMKYSDPAPKDKAKLKQNCATCALYKPEKPNAKLGACQLFAGVEVAASAWCMSYNAKPKA